MFITILFEGLKHLILIYPEILNYFLEQKKTLSIFLNAINSIIY
jgi:hypothetical protein